MPIFLQRIVPPVESVYLASAVIKISTQFCLIWLLSSLVSGRFKVSKIEFLVPAILVTPLFQTNGYRSYMGIIDPSVTYTFFYALPTLVLLLFLVPLFFKLYHSEDLISNSYWRTVLIIPLSLIIAFSGPLNPAIVLVLLFIILLNLFKKTMTSPLTGRMRQFIKLLSDYQIYIFIPVTLFSIYSLYIGHFNSFNFYHNYSLKELYQKLPHGLFTQFTSKLGFPILFFLIVMNSILIKRTGHEGGGKIFLIARGILYFSVLYIMLLPVGGYRLYRPNVIRYDTILPITISLIFIYALTTTFLIKNIKEKYKPYYLSIGLMLLIYTFADEPKFQNNECERASLSKIATSSKEIVEIESNCFVLSWNKIEKFEESELQAQLIRRWNITTKKKYFFNKPN